MVNVCVEIEDTRDIIRQILRHRSFSFQEFLQRYSISNLGVEYKEARLQDTKNRQNSTEIEGNDDLKKEWLEKQQNINELVQESYNWALSNGIAKEQARAILPEGITLSRIYMNRTLRSLLHYIELQSGNGIQKEYQEIAIACANAINEIFPISKIINY
jgi:thymidylate synthase (FAD)